MHSDSSTTLLAFENFNSNPPVWDDFVTPNNLLEAVKESVAFHCIDDLVGALLYKKGQLKAPCYKRLIEQIQQIKELHFDTRISYLRNFLHYIQSIPDKRLNDVKKAFQNAIKQEEKTISVVHNAIPKPNLISPDNDTSSSRSDDEDDLFGSPIPFIDNKQDEYDNPFKPETSGTRSQTPFPVFVSESKNTEKSFFSMIIDRIQQFFINLFSKKSKEQTTLPDLPAKKAKTDIPTATPDTDSLTSDNYNREEISAFTPQAILEIPPAIVKKAKPATPQKAGKQTTAKTHLKIAPQIFVEPIKVDVIVDAIKAIKAKKAREAKELKRRVATPAAEQQFDLRSLLPSFPDLVLCSPELISAEITVPQAKTAEQPTPLKQKKRKKKNNEAVKATEPNTTKAARAHTTSRRNKQEVVPTSTAAASAAKPAILPIAEPAQVGSHAIRQSQQLKELPPFTEIKVNIRKKLVKLNRKLFDAKPLDDDDIIFLKDNGFAYAFLFGDKIIQPMLLLHIRALLYNATQSNNPVDQFATFIRKLEYQIQGLSKYTRIIDVVNWLTMKHFPGKNKIKICDMTSSLYSPFFFSNGDRDIIIDLSFLKKSIAGNNKIASQFGIASTASQWDWDDDADQTGVTALRPSTSLTHSSFVHATAEKRSLWSERGGHFNNEHMTALAAAAINAFSG